MKRRHNMKWTILLLLFISNILVAQNNATIEIGTFNIEWFPCKDDGEMMKEYDIELRYPPKGNATDIDALFSFLKEIDIELLAVQEIVDPEFLKQKAKE